MLFQKSISLQPNPLRPINLQPNPLQPIRIPLILVLLFHNFLISALNLKGQKKQGFCVYCRINAVWNLADE